MNNHLELKIGQYTFDSVLSINLKAQLSQGFQISIRLLCTIKPKALEAALPFAALTVKAQQKFFTYAGFISNWQLQSFSKPDQYLYTLELRDRLSLLKQSFYAALFNDCSWKSVLKKLCQEAEQKTIWHLQKPAQTHLQIYRPLQDSWQFFQTALSEENWQCFYDCRQANCPLIITDQTASLGHKQNVVLFKLQKQYHRQPSGCIVTAYESEHSSQSLQAFSGSAVCPEHLSFFAENQKQAQQWADQACKYNKLLSEQYSFDCEHWLSIGDVLTVQSDNLIVLEFQTVLDPLKCQTQASCVKESNVGTKVLKPIRSGSIPYCFVMPKNESIFPKKSEKGAYFLKPPPWIRTSQRAQLREIRSRQWMTSTDLQSAFPHPAGSWLVCAFGLSQRSFPFILGALNTQQHAGQTNKQNEQLTQISDQQGNQLSLCSFEKNAQLKWLVPFSGQQKAMLFLGDDWNKTFQGISLKVDGHLIIALKGKSQLIVGKKVQYKQLIDPKNKRFQNQTHFKSDRYQHAWIGQSAKIVEQHHEGKILIQEAASEKRSTYKAEQNKNYRCDIQQSRQGKSHRERYAKRIDKIQSETFSKNILGQEYNQLTQTHQITLKALNNKWCIHDQLTEETEQRQRQIHTENLISKNLQKTVTSQTQQINSEKWAYQKIKINTIDSTYAGQLTLFTD